MRMRKITAALERSEELSRLRKICRSASNYFEMCPLNWRTQETGPYSYEKYEIKEANMLFSKTFGPDLVADIIDHSLKETAALRVAVDALRKSSYCFCSFDSKNGKHDDDADSLCPQYINFEALKQIETILVGDE